MPFNFQRFTDTDSSFSAKVTIRKTGQLGFNLGAINLYSIRAYDYCVLYFDLEDRVVGIELTNDKCEGAVEIKKNEANTYVRAKNFCDRFQIHYTESHSHGLEKDHESGFLFFRIDDVNQAKDIDPEEMENNQGE